MNARKTITDYLKGKQEPSDNDLLCFVGMIQGDEAELKDFEEVGGIHLVQLLTKFANEKGYGLTKFGELDENTVKQSFNSKKDLWCITVSGDGHNVTSIPVFVTPHRAECHDIFVAYIKAGYKSLLNGRLS